MKREKRIRVRDDCGLLCKTEWRSPIRERESITQPSSHQPDQQSMAELSKEEQDALDAQNKQREQAEQAGECVWLHGCTVHGPQLTTALPYKWSQDLQTVTVTVPLPSGTRARDCIVAIERKKLKVQVKGSEPILDGELFNDISKDDSSWTIGEVCQLS